MFMVLNVPFDTLILQQSVKNTHTHTHRNRKSLTLSQGERLFLLSRDNDKNKSLTAMSTVASRLGSTLERVLQESPVSP